MGEAAVVHSTPCRCRWVRLIICLAAACLLCVAVLPRGSSGEGGGAGKRGLPLSLYHRRERGGSWLGEESGKTFPSGSALASQVALSQGLMCSQPRGGSRFCLSFAVLPLGSFSGTVLRGKVHASTFMCGIQDMWCLLMRIGA